MTLETLTSYLADDKAIVSPGGFVAVIDQWDAHDAGEHPADVEAADVPGDPAEGSRPGASRTIFIDFGGETIEGTEWNRTVDEETIEVPAYGADEEFQRVVWERVAQDYASFDVNVTTSDPGADALYKTSEDDDEYGAHLLIAPDSSMFPNDEIQSAAGYAWINMFGAEFGAPAVVFADILQDNPSYIGDAGSHEVGHNLSLLHHGIGSDEYYGSTPQKPESIWGPVMGTAYNVPLSTWSHGGYADATNPEQDDLAAITDRDGARHLAALFHQDGSQYMGYYYCSDADDPDVPNPGDRFWTADQETGECLDEELEVRWDYADRLEYASDPHGDTVDDATALDGSSGEFANEGLIVTSEDVDVFSFVTDGGPFEAEVAPIEPATNLDLKLTLLDGDGDVVAENEQETSSDGGPQAQGLNAVLAEELERGAYYLAVEGRGQGDPAENTPDEGSGYPGYGSLGYYELSGTAEPLDAAPITITSPDDGAEVEPSDLEVAGTAEAEAEVTVTVDGDTVSAEADAEGAWVTMFDGDLPTGESMITAQQTVDGIVIPETASVTVTVPGDDPGDEDGTDDGGDEDGTDDGGDEDGTDDGGEGGTENGTDDGGDEGTDGSEDGGDDDGGEDGTDGGTDEGDDDGEDLPDTGTSSMLPLIAGAVMLAIGAALYTRTRKISA